jgi:hypothetical protein
LFFVGVVLLFGAAGAEEQCRRSQGEDGLFHRLYIFRAAKIRQFRELAK